MTWKIFKKIAKIAGVEATRYDRRIPVFNDLFNKYREFTMVPRDLFVENLRLCHDYRSISGDFVECGVWRGGMSAAISEVLGADRKIHLFDSFEGLPSAKEIDGKEALTWQQNVTSEGYYDNCTADQSYAIRAMTLASNQNHKIYKGWFQNTLSEIDTKSIAILRLDGDWYDSIKICLDKLFPLVEPGGLVIIDDYYTWDGCSKAVHDYLSEMRSSSRIFQRNNGIAYLIKKG